VLVVVGFLGHAPGLWLFLGARLDRFASRWNVAVLAATLVAMGVAAATAERPGLSTFVAWLVGHFVWSALISILALRGHVVCAHPARG